MTATFIGVYWKARRMDLPSCARLLERHFQALATASPHLQHWYLKGGRKPKPAKALEVSSIERLETLLDDGAYWTDVPRRLMPELGWRTALWNGADGDEAASTSVNCGFHGTTRGISNVAYLDFKGELGAERALGLLKDLVNVWNPDRGLIRRGPSAESDAEVLVAEYTTSLPKILLGSGERLGRGRLLVP